MISKMAEKLLQSSESQIEFQKLRRRWLGGVRKTLGQLLARVRSVKPFHYITSVCLVPPFCALSVALIKFPESESK